MCVDNGITIESIETRWCGVRLRGHCHLLRDDPWRIVRVQLVDPWRGAWLPGPRMPEFGRQYAEPCSQDGLLTPSGRARAEDLLATLAENLHVLDINRLEGMVAFEAALRGLAFHDEGTLRLAATQAAGRLTTELRVPIHPEVVLQRFSPVGRGV